MRRDHESHMGVRAGLSLSLFSHRVVATYRLYLLSSPLCCQFFFEGRLIFNN